MNNKQKKKKKFNRIKLGAIFLFILIIVAAAVFFSGYGKEEIEHEVRKIKDEAVMQSYEALEVTTVKEEQLVVCLDPGHGGKDPGSIDGERMEKDENLRLALRIKKNLEKYNIKVILTREDDSFVSLEKRARQANKQEADLFVSLHRNYLSGYPEVNGIDIYINCAGTEDDYRIGNALYNKLSAVDGMKVNDVKEGSATDTEENYTVVAKTKMTACLIEMGYMSHFNDNIYFDDYFKSYSIAISEAIVEYLRAESVVSANAAH